MKKAILSALLAGSAVIASCNKEATTTKPAPTRFISYEMAGSTMYTRAPSSNEVLSIISEALPEHVATVFSGTKTLVVNTGEYTQIPSDTYQVSGTFLGEQYGGILSSDCGGVSLQPAVRINQTLTINDGSAVSRTGDKYTVPNSTLRKIFGEQGKDGVGMFAPHLHG